MPDQTVADAKHVIDQEIKALERLKSHIDVTFHSVVADITALSGRVIVSGMGKSGHVARKIAATLASTGTPAQFVHPADASHGDLGMITAADLVLVISKSGETQELADLLAYTRRYSIPLVAITQEPASALGQQADRILRLPDVPEACMLQRAPTTSTTCTIALGDALAVAIMKARNFDEKGFLAFHPGGALGAQLLPVSHLMHRGADLPLVKDDTPMKDVLIEMTTKGLGIALLVDDHHCLRGVITDGDLRRNLSDLMGKTAGDICTRAPYSVQPETLVETAIHEMNRRKISALAVTTEQGALRGLIHIQDCLRAGRR